jgi:hypothetical protein
MALPTPGDRAAETSTTTGTGTYDLAGEIDGWRTIVAACGTGETVDYFARDAAGGSDYEVGRGVITDAGTDTLTRAVIHTSSNGGAAVNWGAGTREIVVTLTANAMNQLLADEDIGVNVQAYSTGLSAISALDKTDSNFIVGNGSTWVLEDASGARTSLGLGTAATTASADYATAAQGTTADNALVASTVSAFGATLIDDADASTARTTLGNVASLDVQNTFTKAQIASTYTAALSATSGVLDYDTYQNFIITLASGSNTLAAVTTEASQAGQTGVIVLVQPSSSSAGTVSLHGDYETAEAAGLTLSSANNDYDVVPYLVKADNSILLGTPQLNFG